MRFGFCTIPFESFSGLAELVRFAEKLGFGRYWMPDQSFFDDPFATLGALSQQTEQIGLGLAVVNPFTRHPALVARSAASMAKITGNRFILAYGGGNRLENVERLKLNSEGTARKCREAIEIVRRMSAGEEVNREGPLWPMDRVRIQFPLPPPFPIYLAVRGPRMLRAAGRAADGVILGSMAKPEVIRFAVGEMRKAALEAGRDPLQVTPAGWVICIIADDPSSVRETMRGAAGHSVANSPAKEIEILGLDPGKVAEVREAYRSGGREKTVPLVTDEMIEDFYIIDTPKGAARRIRALMEAGITEFNVLMPTGGGGGSYGVSGFDHRKNLERFAQEVIPLLA